MILIWETKTNRKIASLQGHDGKVFCLAVNKQKVVSGSNDETIIIWDLKTKK